MTIDTERQLMTVGELSRRTGVSVKNLRQYTDWGLVYTVGRSAGNYRLFDNDALWCLQLIGTLRQLGVTVAEIRELTHEYLDHGCDQPFGPLVAKRLHTARARIEDRIAELQQTLHRINEFESRHQAELSDRPGVDLGADDPRQSCSKA
ncbi:MerR family transcriptional regulator [Jiangella alkaliphila]|uniref:DNA-binding transcriptional regulator, MerR family n=1 Tax=Jiangella alkaliphila TaxID=419479 RepID=A0A1H2GZN2_9ACTN|nr:MerR family transcriptional regulator [Jiangella alkaliphila]SDU24965.1 DNA-binding transcriptional regulator, MerR family [Jiangella alkaliphila]